MTKTSMRIAVGKVVGLKCDDLTSAQMDDMGVPDYPDDLNAMHQVELYLQGDEWATYFSWIQYHGNATGTQSTAAQRCEGFLRAKGLLKGNMSDPLPPKTNVPIEDRLTERAAKSEFDMKDLLPCPFCQCEAAVAPTDKRLGCIAYDAFCSNCYATLTGHTVQEAKDKWNHRANPRADRLDVLCGEIIGFNYAHLGHLTYSDQHERRLLFESWEKRRKEA